MRRDGTCGSHEGEQPRERDASATQYICAANNGEREHNEKNDQYTPHITKV
jgi:hypothetical protein